MTIRGRRIDRVPSCGSPPARMLGDRWVRGGATASLLLIRAAVALAGDDTTRTSSIFAPVSEPADASLTAATLVLAITAGIFVVVGGLLAFSIVRFRRRPDDDGREPAQV